MRLRKITKLMPLVCVAIFLSMPIPANAQNYWLHPEKGKNITLEASKISFDRDAEFDFLTSVWFLSLHYQIIPTFTFVAEIPFSNFGAEGYEGKTMIGNPLLGFRLSMANTGPVLNMGVRMPLAQDDKWDAVWVGIYGSFDRFEAFLPDVASVYLSGGYHYEIPSGLIFECALGPNLMMPTEDEGTESELYIDYNAEIWYYREQGGVGFGFSGRLLATEADLDFGERTVHQLGLAGKIALGNILPGFQIRLPLDAELGDYIDVVYGLNVTMRLK